MAFAQVAGRVSAVEALRNGMWRLRGGFVLEVDIQTFFDSLDHTCLREILDKRVRDGDQEGH